MHICQIYCNLLLPQCKALGAVALYSRYSDSRMPVVVMFLVDMFTT